VRIMVTLPSAAGDDEGELVGALIDAGMDCARVNTAHDDAATWRRMIEAVRRAADQRGRPGTVVADLGGPKVRTGPLEAGPAVVRIHPSRDAIGRVVRPAVVALVRSGAPDDGTVDLTVPVVGGLLSDLADGDEVSMDDARGK